MANLVILMNAKSPSVSDWDNALGFLVSELACHSSGVKGKRFGPAPGPVDSAVKYVEAYLVQQVDYYSNATPPLTNNLHTLFSLYDLTIKTQCKMVHGL